jgi:hypothetical protein
MPSCCGRVDDVGKRSEGKNDARRQRTGLTVFIFRDAQTINYWLALRGTSSMPVVVSPVSRQLAGAASFSDSPFGGRSCRVLGDCCHRGASELGHVTFHLLRESWGLTLLSSTRFTSILNPIPRLHPSLYTSFTEQRTQPLHSAK